MSEAPRAPGRRGAPATPPPPPSPLGAPAPAAPGSGARAAAEPVHDVPEGFVPLPGKEATHIIATKDIYCHFTPRNTKRESTVLICSAGTSMTPGEYHKRVGQYMATGRIETK